MPDRHCPVDDPRPCPERDRAIVSVTRFRARSLVVLPLFVLHAQRAIAQVQAAAGYIAGAVRQDADLVLWTMTVWCDEPALEVYVASGAHGRAMPHLQGWGAEAAVVRWAQDGSELPDWATAERRLRDQGHAPALRHPGPGHADLSFAERPMRCSGRLRGASPVGLPNYPPRVPLPKS
jgi:hypothetical protein